MRAATKKRIARYWGYLLLIALYVGWFELDWDPIALGIISALIVFYMLFQAPVPCCAKTREYEFCRNNARAYFAGVILKITSGRTSRCSYASRRGLEWRAESSGESAATRQPCQL